MTRTIRYLIAGLTLGVILLLLIGTLFRGVILPGTGRLDLLRAQLQWTSHGYEDYRLQVVSSAGSVLCGTVEYTVIGGQVAEILREGYEGCQTYTVDDLFERIRKFEPRCGHSGCVCDGVTVMEVRYDPEAGYPTDIVYRLDFDLRKRYAGYWLHQIPLVPHRGCPWSGNVGYTIHVLSLTPLE